VPFEDLVQEGMIGLVRAVERFDHRRGARFASYAIWWIRRSLLEALGDARTIRIPPSARQQIAMIRRADAELRGLGSPLPSDEEIAERAGLGVKTVRALRTAPRVSASLDQPIGDDDTPLGELIGDEAALDAWQRADDADVARALWALLGRLPQRQREILLRRYGLRGDREQTYREIAADLGVSQERSRQLEDNALRSLRKLAVESQLAA
jgi:RNA polymerase primary sigma factor